MQHQAHKRQAATQQVQHRRSMTSNSSVSSLPAYVGRLAAFSFASPANVRSVARAFLEGADAENARASSVGSAQAARSERSPELPALSFARSHLRPRHG